MAADNREIQLTLSLGDIVGRGGPVSGSAGAVLGALVVLLAFFLPWVSCATLSLSALDVASGEVPSEVAAGSSAFLYLLPALALATLAFAVGTIFIAVWPRLPRFTSAATAVAMFVTSALMLLPHVVFYVRFQAVKSREGAFALTSLIRLEEGFWVSVVGVLLSMMSAVVAILTAGMGLVLSPDETPSSSNGDAD